MSDADWVVEKMSREELERELETRRDEYAATSEVLAAAGLPEIEDVADQGRWHSLASRVKTLAAECQGLRRMIRTRTFVVGESEIQQRRAFSAAVFVYERGLHGRLLLIKHKLLNLWLPVGGELESGETPLEAAERELREETGLARPIVEWPNWSTRIRIAAPTGYIYYEEHVAGPKGLHMNFNFAAVLTGDSPELVSDGSWTEHRWVTSQELAAMADAGETPQNVAALGQAGFNEKLETATLQLLREVPAERIVFRLLDGSPPCTAADMIGEIEGGTDLSRKYRSTLLRMASRGAERERSLVTEMSRLNLRAGRMTLFEAVNAIADWLRFDSFVELDFTELRVALEDDIARGAELPTGLVCEALVCGNKYSEIPAGLLEGYPTTNKFLQKYRQ